MSTPNAKTRFIEAFVVSCLSQPGMVPIDEKFNTIYPVRAVRTALKAWDALERAKQQADRIKDCGLELVTIFANDQPIQ